MNLHTIQKAFQIGLDHYKASWYFNFTVSNIFNFEVNNEIVDFN